MLLRLLLLALALGITHGTTAPLTAMVNGDCSVVTSATCAVCPVTQMWNGTACLARPAAGVLPQGPGGPMAEADAPLWVLQLMLHASAKALVAALPAVLGPNGDLESPHRAAVIATCPDDYSSYVPPFVAEGTDCRTLVCPRDTLAAGPREPCQRFTGANPEQRPV